MTKFSKLQFTTNCSYCSSELQFRKFQRANNLVDESGIQSVINEQQAAKSSKSTRKFACLNLRREVEVDANDDDDDDDDDESIIE